MSFLSWCEEYANERMFEEYGSCCDEEAYEAFLYEAGEEYFLRFGLEDDE